MITFHILMFFSLFFPVLSLFLSFFCSFVFLFVSFFTFFLSFSLKERRVEARATHLPQKVGATRRPKRGTKHHDDDDDTWRKQSVQCAAKLTTLAKETSLSNSGTAPLTRCDSCVCAFCSAVPFVRIGTEASPQFHLTVALIRGFDVSTQETVCAWGIGLAPCGTQKKRRCAVTRILHPPAVRGLDTKVAYCQQLSSDVHGGFLSLTYRAFTVHRLF